MAVFNVRHLLEEAAIARTRAYVPYSGFAVGSALLTSEGQILHGCNVENAAYSPSNCAERTVLFRAIADGHVPKTFAAIAVIGDVTVPLSPCGVCRQVLAELCDPHMPVIMSNMKGDIKQMTVAELLPETFTLSNRMDGK